MKDLLFLIPLLPLVAAVVNFLFGRWYLRDLAGPIATIAVIGSWVVSLLVFIDQLGSDEPLSQHLYTWIPAGDFQVPVTLYVDHLAAVMLMVVTTVSALVHVYSNGYMAGDTGFYRFFSYLPLFVFSMLMLVLADNYLLLFFFWEGVGLCSYLLIGYYFKRTSATQAAKKAFIVNRVGDVGFGIGVMLIFVKTGSIVFSEVFAQVGSLAGSTITLIGILLFIGATGKSAQLPLFVWLPDAMEGPTPVSALIHAATMVTAGIYMVARSFPIYVATDDARLLIAIIGAVTAFIAGTIAVTQFDIKRVIAYSTVSQLGYMAFALGVGAWAPAIFHLVTHAFFKGLLFLGSGSVIHGMHEEQDMRRMGGLKKYMPITYWTFLIAAAANAGLIPMSGFWSKDEIIVGAWLDHSYVIMIIGLIVAFFTSLYMFRVVFLTFHGKERFDPQVVRPHESPRVMTIPLILLAIPAALIGFIGFPPENGWIHDFLEPNFTVGGAEAAMIASLNAVEGATGHHVSLATTLTLGAISTLIALAGLWIAYMAYIKRSSVFDPSTWAARLGGLYTFVSRKWLFDEVYETFIVHPLYMFSVFLWRVVDDGIIDGTVNGVAGIVGFTSSRLRRVQTGFVANYALAIALGAVVIVGAYFVFVSNLFS
ncbi:MAG TPA: NADH-quinone oxidoreductase subunit L [Thermomicrobiales bacterium]|nr:NADH-quinone oxidoreductase subunit L [Thermomicrobiales bacterium]